MDYKIKKLTNGLRVLTVEMPSLESVTISIWVKTGSRNEKKQHNGISHFLEHMVFKGSKKRPTAREISQVVDSMGGEFNAGTSKDWTNFYIKSRAGNLEMALDVLSDMVFNPILDSKEIEREKGTIVEEIRMYEDTPMYRIGDVFEQLAFEGNPLGWDIAGIEKTVRSIKRADFDAYRREYYYPENILITVAGGVKESTTLNLIKKYLKNVVSKKRENNISKDFKIVQTKPKSKLYSKKKEQAHFIVGFLGEGRGYENRFAQGILSAILGGGMSSRLFIEVRERRGLAYSVRTSVDRYSDVGYIGTYAGVDPKKADEALKIILDQSYGLASGKFPITPKELTKSKEYIKGHLALALEDTKDVGSFFGEQALFLKEVLTPEEIYKKIDKITVSDVLKEAKKLLVPERLNFAVIGPYNSSNKFDKVIY